MDLKAGEVITGLLSFLGLAISAITAWRTNVQKQASEDRKNNKEIDLKREELEFSDTKNIQTQLQWMFEEANKGRERAEASAEKMRIEVEKLREEGDKAHKERSKLTAHLLEMEDNFNIREHALNERERVMQQEKIDLYSKVEALTAENAKLKALKNPSIHATVQIDSNEEVSGE